MDIKQMLVLHQFLEAIVLTRKAEEDNNGVSRGESNSNNRISYLSAEERDILRQVDQEVNLGKNYRLHLLRLANLIGIEPEQLVYLHRLAGLGVTAIE